MDLSIKDERPNVNERALRGRTRHYLKSQSQFFRQIKSGERKFDIRSTADRDFKVGDEIIFDEYSGTVPTNWHCLRIITCILRHMPGAGCAAELGLNPGYVILGIE